MKNVFTFLFLLNAFHSIIAQDWRSESGVPVKITSLARIQDTLFLATNNQVFFSKNNGPFQIILDPPKYNNNPNPFQSNGKFLSQETWFYPGVTIQQIFSSDVFGGVGSLVASFDRGITNTNSPGYQSYTSIKGSSRLESVFGNDQGRVGYYSSQSVSNFGLSYSTKFSKDGGRTWESPPMERYERPLAFYQNKLVTQLEQQLRHKDLTTGQVLVSYPIPERKFVLESNGVLVVPGFSSSDSVQASYNYSKDWGVTWETKTISWDHLDFWKLTPSGDNFFDKVIVVGNQLMLWDGLGSKEIWTTDLSLPQLTAWQVPCQVGEYITNFFESKGHIYVQLNSGKLYTAAGIFQPWVLLPLPRVAPNLLAEQNPFKWVPNVGWVNNDQNGLYAGALQQNIFVKQGDFSFQGQGNLLTRLGNQYILVFDRKLYSSSALPVVQKTLLALPPGFQQVLNSVEVFDNGLILWGYDNTTFQYRFAISFDAIHWTELPGPPGNETPVYLRHLKGKTYLRTVNGIYILESGQWVLTTGTYLAETRQYDVHSGKYFLLNDQGTNANCGMELLLSDDGIHWVALALPQAPVIWAPCNYVGFYAVWYSSGQVLLSGNNQLYRLVSNGWESVQGIPFAGAPGFAGRVGDRLYFNTTVQGLWSADWKTLFPKPTVNCAQNILSNGDFQSGSTGWEGNGTLIIEPDGNKFVRGCATNEPPRVNLKVQPGKNYALKAIARKSNAQSKGTLSLKFLTASWQVINQSIVAIQSTDWSLYELSALAPPNAYWLEVALRSADQHCVEADDFCVSTDGVSGPLPDLVAMGTVPANFPASLVSGATFNYNINFQNNGDAAVMQPFKYALFLSRDQTLDAQDLRISEQQVFAPFEVFPKSSGAAGGIASLPVVQPGSYYWIFVLDPDGLIAEKNKSNNIFTQPMNVVTDGLPNFRLKSMNLSTQQIQAGASFTLDYHFVNDGQRAVTQGHVDKMWLSRDAMLSADDVLLFTYQAGPNVIPVYGTNLFAAYSRGTFNVNIPAATPSGNWFVVMEMNADESFEETSRNDNVLSTYMQVKGINTNCQASSDFPWEDWISNVRIASESYPSGKSQYSNYAGKVFPVSADQSIPIAVSVTFSWKAYSEYMRIWVDSNQDGLYESSELWWSGVLSQPSDGYGEYTRTGTALVPSNWVPGFYKMRVMMTRNQYPEPCGTIPFGEVEDYTLEILQNSIPGSQIRNPEKKELQNDYRVSRFALYPVPAADYIWMETSSWTGQELHLSLINLQGKNIRSWNISEIMEPWTLLDLSGVPAGTYFLQAYSPGRRTLVSPLLVEPGY